MSTNNKGKPAFPTKRHVCRDGYLTNKHEPYGGMTLRDIFAAKAMQGYVSVPDWRVDIGPEETARAAYTQADAMLKARGA